MRQLLRRSRADFGPRAIGGDDTGVDRRAVRDHRADRPGGLARRIEEGRTRSGVVADVHASGKSSRPRKIPLRAELEQARRTASRFCQMVVELIRQEVLQRKGGARADRGAHQCEQDDLRDKQPRPQRPCPWRPQARQPPAFSARA
jgi:hypothetical protein